MKLQIENSLEIFLRLLYNYYKSFRANNKRNKSFK